MSSTQTSETAVNAFQNWSDGLEASDGLAAKTAIAYRQDVLSLIGFVAKRSDQEATLAHIELLKPRDIRAWLAERRTQGLEESASISRALSAIKHFFQHLKVRHGIALDQVLAMSGPKRKQRLPRPTSESQTEALLASSELDHQEPWVQARDYAVLTLIYSAGLRVSEALSLNGDMVPAPDTLRIVGKGDKTRIVPLIEPARRAIDTYADLCPFTLAADQPLFFGVRGKRLGARAVQALMERLRHGLDLPASATPHALRHAFASHLLNEGGDLRSIQTLLGHSSPSTTQVYLGLEDTRLKAAFKSAHPRA